MKKVNKKIITAILAVAIVLSIGIGGTLAYLNVVTPAEVNKLTFIKGNDDMKATLTEPNWVPAKGLSLLPGAVVPKDPKINNTSVAAVNEWVSIKVTYEIVNAGATPATAMNAAQVATLMKVIDIDYDTTKWEREGSAPVNGFFCFYKDQLAQGTSTIPLFNNVTVKSGAAAADLEELAAFAPNGINIKVQGAIIQTATLTYAQAQTELKKLIPVA